MNDLVAAGERDRQLMNLDSHKQTKKEKTKELINNLLKYSKDT